METKKNNNERLNKSETNQQPTVSVFNWSPPQWWNHPAWRFGWWPQAWNEGIQRNRLWPTKVQWDTNSDTKRGFGDTQWYKHTQIQQKHMIFWSIIIFQDMTDPPTKSWTYKTAQRPARMHSMLMAPGAWRLRFRQIHLAIYMASMLDKMSEYPSKKNMAVRQWSQIWRTSGKSGTNFVEIRTAPGWMERTISLPVDACPQRSTANRSCSWIWLSEGKSGTDGLLASFSWMQNVMSINVIILSITICLIDRVVFWSLDDPIELQLCTLASVVFEWLQHGGPGSQKRRWRLEPKCQPWTSRNPLAAKLYAFLKLSLPSVPSKKVVSVPFG